jgi:putative flippase GtrA
MTKQKRFLSYVTIGLFTTFFVFIIWNVLIWLGKSFLQELIPFSVLFSVSQFVASIVMILPSFYLNRKITFQDKNRKNNRLISTLKAYSIYILSPLIASLTTYLLQNIYNFESLQIALIFDIKIGRLFLQGLGLGIGMIINYFGQKFWIYK